MIVVSTPESSVIEAMAYDSHSEVLCVQIGNRVYSYRGVSRGTFYRLRNSSSKGRFFTKNIKGNARYTTLPRQNLTMQAA